jgi:hypothetical protein
MEKFRTFRFLNFGKSLLLFEITISEILKRHFDITDQLRWMSGKLYDGELTLNGTNHLGMEIKLVMSHVFLQRKTNGTVLVQGLHYLF